MPGQIWHGLPHVPYLARAMCFDQSAHDGLAGCHWLHVHSRATQKALGAIIVPHFGRTWIDLDVSGLIAAITPFGGVKVLRGISQLTGEATPHQRFHISPRCFAMRRGIRAVACETATGMVVGTARGVWAGNPHSGRDSRAVIELLFPLGGYGQMAFQGIRPAVDVLAANITSLPLVAAMRRAGHQRAPVRLRVVLVNHDGFGEPDQLAAPIVEQLTGAGHARLVSSAQVTQTETSLVRHRLGTTRPAIRNARTGAVSQKRRGGASGDA